MFRVTLASIDKVVAPTVDILLSGLCWKIGGEIKSMMIGSRGSQPLAADFGFFSQAKPLADLLQTYELGTKVGSRQSG